MNCISSLIEGWPIRPMAINRLVLLLFGGIVSLFTFSHAVAQIDLEETANRVSRNRPATAADRMTFANPQQYVHQVNSKHCVCYSNGDVELAELVVAEFTRTWRQMESVADRFTRVHRVQPDPYQPRFEVGPVAVFVDRRPLSNHHGPPATFHAVGNGTMIYLNISNGAPSIAAQIPRLRLATAHAFMHESKLSEQLPQWATDGLAGYVARLDLEDAASFNQHDPSLPAFRGFNRRWRRTEWENVEAAATAEAEAASRMKFLLESGDAQFALDLINALIETANRNLPYDKARLLENLKPEFLQPVSQPTTVEQLFESLQPNYHLWLEDPHSGQPMVKNDQVLRPELAALQEEMTWILKLLARFGNEPAARASQSVRVSEFKRPSQIRPASNNEPVKKTATGDDKKQFQNQYKGQSKRTNTVVRPPSNFQSGVVVQEFQPRQKVVPPTKQQNDPNVGDTANKQKAPKVETITFNLSVWKRSILTSRETWATLGPRGRLILSTDRQQLRELLNDIDRRFQAQRRGTDWVLTHRRRSGELVVATLSASSEPSARPTVQFRTAR